VNGTADRLEASLRRLAEMRPALEAGEPWPLSDRMAPGPESEWGPAEVLAHIAEMLPYWRGQMDLIRASGDAPAAFGRVQTDQSRIDRIDQARQRPAGELLDSIAGEVAATRRWLSGLGEEELTLAGVHPTLGEMSVAVVLERMIAGHLEEHVDQLAGILS
jgi:hypothetical protein